MELNYIRVVKNFWFALIVLIAVETQAQSDFRPGFVVLNNGDTVSGYLEYSVRDIQEKECRFRREKQGTTTHYSPVELTGYGFESGRQYVTRTIPIEGDNRSVFLQRLQSGRANLYLYDDKFYLEKDSLFQLPVPKKREVNTDNGMYVVQDNLYVGLLSMTFADCKMELKNPAYEIRWLSKAVQAYNRCTGSVTVTDRTSSTWTKVNWQLFGGVKYVGSDSESNLFSFFPLAGASLELSSPIVNDKLFLCVELMYFKYYSQRTEEYVNPLYTMRIDYTYRSSTVSVPIGIRYNLMPEVQTIYFKCGILLNHTFNPSGSTTIEREQAGVVTTSYSEVTTENFQGTGFWVGAGYLKSFRPKLNVFLEIRAELSGNLNLLGGLRF